MNKRLMYNRIMESVAREVKKALNESDYTNGIYRLPSIEDLEQLTQKSAKDDDSEHILASTYGKSINYKIISTNGIIKSPFGEVLTPEVVNISEPSYFWAYDYDTNELYIAKLSYKPDDYEEVLKDIGDHVYIDDRKRIYGFPIILCLSWEQYYNKYDDDDYIDLGVGLMLVSDEETEQDSVDLTGYGVYWYDARNAENRELCTSPADALKYT